MTTGSNSIGRDVTQAIRTEDVSRMASRIAVHAPVRRRCVTCSWVSAGAPGLVADGRDMGTVVFPSADLKVFLTASLERVPKGAISS